VSSSFTIFKHSSPSLVARNYPTRSLANVRLIMAANFQSVGGPLPVDFETEEAMHKYYFRKAFRFYQPADPELSDGILYKYVGGPDFTYLQTSWGNISASLDDSWELYSRINRAKHEACDEDFESCGVHGFLSIQSTRARHFNIDDKMRFTQRADKLVTKENRKGLGGARTRFRWGPRQEKG
jgi:hypothetical protein